MAARRSGALQDMVDFIYEHTKVGETNEQVAAKIKAAGIGDYSVGYVTNIRYEVKKGKRQPRTAAQRWKATTTAGPLASLAAAMNPPPPTPVGHSAVVPIQRVLLDVKYVADAAEKVGGLDRLIEVAAAMKAAGIKTL